MKQLYRITLLLAVFILNGCASTYPYIEAAAHNRSVDSEYNEHWWIMAIGVEHEFNKNFTIFLEHESMPLVYEDEGEGVNKLGGKLRFR